MNASDVVDNDPLAAIDCGVAIVEFIPLLFGQCGFIVVEIRIECHCELFEFGAVESRRELLERLWRGGHAFSLPRVSTVVDEQSRTLRRVLHIAVSPTACGFFASSGR